MTAVLVSRFLLNLQEANKDAAMGINSVSELSNISEDKTINFARVMGSIGESFGPGVSKSGVSSFTEVSEDTVRV